MSELEWWPHFLFLLRDQDENNHYYRQGVLPAQVSTLYHILIQRFSCASRPGPNLFLELLEL